MYLANSEKYTREDWLNHCSQEIVNTILAPSITIRKGMKVKICVGYPPNSRVESKKIGVCLPSSVSQKGYNEIYIIPSINDSVRVLDILTHELLHAVDDNQHGHKAPFPDWCKAIGLEGKPTATTAGAELEKKLKGIVRKFGKIPHAQVDGHKLRRQGTRNIKVMCECGFKFNTSRSQIERFFLSAAMECPCCKKPMDAPDWDGIDE